MSQRLLVLAFCALVPPAAAQTFDDLAAASGVDTILENSASASWGDYDRDGRLDLFVACNTANELFHNEGDGWIDLFIPNWNHPDLLYHNNDEDLDLYVPESSVPSTESGRHYINQGDGTFVEAGMRSGLRFEHELGLNPRGASWATPDRPLNDVTAM